MLRASPSRSLVRKIPFVRYNGHIYESDITPRL
jgi:hypothetical protein